jgi:hypothetical protein
MKELYFDLLSLCVDCDCYIPTLVAPGLDGIRDRDLKATQFWRWPCNFLPALCSLRHRPLGEVHLRPSPQPGGSISGSLCPSSRLCLPPSSGLPCLVLCP